MTAPGMQSDITAVLKARRSNYGEFSRHAAIVQAFKNHAHNAPSWPAMTPDEREAVDMILHKLGRILNGNPHYRDSWTDIIGYATLVEQACTE